MADPHQNPLENDRDALARFADERPAEAGIRSSAAAARIVAGLKALAGLFVAMLLVPANSRCVARKTADPERLVDAEAGVPR